MRQILTIVSLAILCSCAKTNCKEQEKLNCAATFELNPVCGCNGVTYDNSSIAACKNITEYTSGACE